MKNVDMISLWRWKCSTCLGEGKLAKSLFLSEKAVQSHQSFQHPGITIPSQTNHLKNIKSVSADFIRDYMKPALAPNQDEPALLDDLLFNLIETPPSTMSQVTLQEFGHGPGADEEERTAGNVSKEASRKIETSGSAVAEVSFTCDHCQNEFPKKASLKSHTVLCKNKQVDIFQKILEPKDSSQPNPRPSHRNQYSKPIPTNTGKKCEICEKRFKSDHQWR